jgi:hypothetical protein
MHYHYTVALEGMVTGMWLMAGTTIASIVIVSVAWYFVRRVDAQGEAIARVDIAECEANEFEARVKAFEAACKFLKTAEDVDRMMGTMGLIEKSKGAR